MNWIRENSKTIIILTVAAFVATIFFQWGMNYLGQRGGSREMATVGEKTILVPDFQERLRQRQEQFRQQNSSITTTETQNRLRRETFRQMVNEIILQRYLREVGIPASDAHVRAFIRQRYFTSPQGEFNRQGWQRFLNRASAQEKTQLEETHREQIETNRMQEWLASQLSLTSVEVDQLLRTGLREVHLQGIFLDPANYVSSERIREYYRANDKRFQAPPRARILEIFFDLGDTNPAQNQQKLETLQDELETIKRQFETGEPIENLVKEFSDHPDTEPRWVTPNDLPPRASRAIFGMEENQLSNLVKSDTGYHLYYVQEGPIQEKTPLPNVRSQIVSAILSDTHWHQARQRAESLHKQIVSHSEPAQHFGELARRHSDGKSAESGGNYGWVPARFIVPSLYAESDSDVWLNEISNEFLVDPEISNAVFSSDQRSPVGPVRSEYGYHVLMPLEFRSARLSELINQDRRLITRLLRQEKSSHFLREWLEREREQLEIELQVPESQIGGSLDEI